MKKNWNKNHEGIITFLVFITVFIGVLTLFAFLGGAVMTIFGFEYKSIGSVILFFLIAAVISYPFGLIAEILPKVLLAFGKMSKNAAILLYLILDTTVTSCSLSIVDYFMRDIWASDISIIAAAFFLSLAGVNDMDKKPDGV